MRESIKTFKDLIVWQKAHQFVLEIYKISKSFPKEETYALTSQVRRASVSIPANIAEGFTRKSDLEKLRFYNISQGSLEEVRYYLVLIQDLKYVETTALMKKLEEVSKILNGFIKSIRKTGS